MSNFANQENNRVIRKPQFLNKSSRYLLITAAFFCFVLFVTCTPEMIAEQFASPKKTEESVITALIPEEEVINEEAPAVTQMVLESGNYWTRGIPGFGENALSAFAGEYRVPGKTETVKIRLTMEFLYYEDWANRNSALGFLISEKTENKDRIIAFPLNDFWTAILLLPLELVLNEEEENRIITGFINKFRGFSGQGQNISLPALIPY